MNELDFFTTKQLLEELQARYPSTVFIGQRNEDIETASYTYQFQGDPLRLIGLCRAVESELMSVLKESHAEPLE